MKILKQISLTLGSLLLSVGMAHGSAVDTCMATISQHNDTFLDPLYSEIVGSGTELNQDIVKQNKAKILSLIAVNISKYCMSDLPAIADVARAKLPFVHNDQKYAFNFSVPEMFEYIDIVMGIMVYNNRTKSYPDKIKVDDIKDIYWSDECSDLVIYGNLDNDAAVNVAGQRAFTAYGGSKNEFFLDFNKGNNMRAFPGLVIMDATNWNNVGEKLVIYKNFVEAKQAAENFAAALKNSACSNQNLAVYLVGFTAKELKNARKQMKAFDIWGRYLTVGLSFFFTEIPAQLQEIEEVQILAGPYNI